MTSPTDFTSSHACSSRPVSLRKRTCWQTDTDSQSDEEPPPAKRQRTTDPPTPRTGGAHDGGQQFEIKMAAVIGLRGMEMGDNFELATNAKDAGNFDDLVYTTNGRRYFLHLKHTEHPDTTKLEPKEMVTLLHECFESYYKIEDRDNSEFVIYTNKRLGWKLSGHEIKETVVDIVERVFKTSANGEVFNFISDKNRKIDVYTRVEKLVKDSKGFGELSVSEQNCKVSMISTFLQKLVMVTGQKGQCKLDKVISNEIQKGDEIKVGRKVYEQVLSNFKTLVECWWRNRNENMTPEILRNCLQKAKTACCSSLVSSLCDSCTKNLTETGVKFTDSEISRLQAELSNENAVHLRSDALTLCSTLVLDCLATSKCIFVNLESLQGNKNMLLYAWLGGHWECLIVYCDSTVQQSDISDTFRNISDNIKLHTSNKRVIILTKYSVKQVTGFVPIDHKFHFEQLSKESQAMVLDKKIDFQGCEVTMRSVLQRHGNVEHVLGPELVTDLITDGTAVNIGGKLYVNTDYYAPRVLERKVWLLCNVLRNKNDVFAVSGTTKEEVLNIVPSDKTVEFVSPKTDFTQDMSSRIFLLPDEDVKDSYLAICKKLEGKPLHWVEFNNGCLLWKMSQGDTDSLLDYVDVEKTRADKRIVAECMKSGSCEVNEESIWDLDERTVLVVAEPGMGKSNTTTQVAWHTKQRDPTSWVVRKNWNDHTGELQELDAATFNLNTLVEFLCSAAFPRSKYTDINRSLLKQALQNTGNITVLMDGFDEISPTYADKAAVILSELTNTKVGRLWVTSRPVEKERLERELCVTAYGMKSLSRTFQEEILRRLWISKASGEESTLLFFIEDILLNLYNSFYVENFTGSPLYVKMIAAVYEKDIETCLKSKVRFRPKIDLDYLYGRFVEMKLDIYLTEKQKADITNPSVLSVHEDFKQMLLIKFKKCALAAVLPPPMLESLHNKTIEEDIQPFLRNVKAGKDKTGVVMNVVEGKPQFVHRTFAEYFTARWFSENFKSNRSVLEHIIFDPQYSFMTNMFDRMLARDCPLHCAVIDGDKKLTKTLLGKECDINSVDKGGRSVMHMLAARGWRFTHYPGLFTDFTYLVPYYKVALDNTDCVLQWTPLQYAIKSEYWVCVEWLLESNVDRSGLDMIRQRAHDTDYIDPIIIESAQQGHMLLLEFIRSIGVNIHQATSSSFPSPLHAAMQSVQQLQVVRWLIKHGADCNTRDSDGQTPLMKALARGPLDVVRVLMLEGDASLDVNDKRDTRCRIDSGISSDQEPPPANRQRTTDPHTNRTGGAHDGGQQFEIKMAAVIGLRGMQRGDNFELATNVKDAGNFDDLVYTTNGRRYCLQLKYTPNPDTNKLVHSKLVPLLQACFETYKNMADKDKTEFIIYTNKQLGSSLLNHTTEEADVDMIFKTSDKGKIFKFNNKEADICTPLEKSLKKSKEYLNLRNPEKEFKEFLNKLIIFAGQKGQWKLDDLIAEEIRKHDAIKLDHTEYKSILDHFKTPLENWWRNRNEKLTPQMLRDWLQRAKTEYCTPLVRGFFKSCTNDFVRTGIKFSDCEISRLQAELSNKRAVHLSSDALTLCSILLLDCLPQSKCIFVNFECLQSNKTMLLHAWLGGHWECLIVSCDVTVQQSDISDTCLETSKRIKCDPSHKRVIILTHFSVKEIQTFTRIDHKFNFEQLSKKSQAMVLDKKIDFQGCEVTMRSVLQRHGNVEHVLGPELVTDLITEETAVNIGGKLQENTGYYAPRILERKVLLPKSILRDRSTYPDVFAVSGLQKNELLKIVPSEEKVVNFKVDEDIVTENSTQNCMFEKGRFFLLTGINLKTSFLKLCDNHSRDTLHWLKYKDGQLLWKETRGDIGNLLDCIDGEGTVIDKWTLRESMKSGRCEVNEESIWDLGERTVLVVAEPGMGKSSTTTQVAWHTKERDPTSWVVRINWNDHTRELQELNAATFNLDTIVIFLCNAAFPHSKYPDINRSLIKQALQSSGNVTVLMDGFDEISPTYADRAAVILSSLMNTKVGRVWVTSRPLKKDSLEKMLSVIAFSMKRLSYASQKQILLKLWLPKTNGYKEQEYLDRFIKESLLLVYELYDDKNFTGTPVYVKMIANVLELMVERNLKSGDFNVPKKIDLIHLYDRFIEMIIPIQEKEKKREFLKKAAVQDDHELLMETCLENLEKCSLLVTVPSAVNSLNDETIEQTTELFIRNFQAGNDKTGVVMNVVEGKPQFVHRTFAEYFTARWFSKNFESNRSVLENILFDRSYVFVRNVFDRILTRGCPLHNAVLDGDTEAVETLLKEGSDVNARDKGGRTVMHITAAEGHVGHICEEITNSLLRHRVCVNAEDNVLEWTPLRYAVKTENWFVVDRLLERDCKGTELEFIRSADDDYYIGKIIVDIAGKNYSSLLQYLATICANTKWESLVKAAVARK